MDAKIKIMTLFIGLICFNSCALTESIRYDSNSDRYKRQHGIQMQSAKTHSGPNSGNYYTGH